jgi:hypothetical protein
LILDLYRSDPTNPRLPALMEERWKSLIFKERKLTPAVMAEVDRVFAEARNEGIRITAAYVKTAFIVDRSKDNPSAALKAVEEFIRLERLTVA